MASLIQLPNPAAGQITQRNLAEYRLLRKEVREARHRLRVMRDELTNRLREGAGVEDGITEVELVTLKRGNKSVERLVVRG
jgi:hypothetical protein